MVRFNPVSKGEPLPSASGGGDPGGRPGYSDKPPLAQRKDKASSRTRNPRRFKKAGSSRYSYDAGTASQEKRALRPDRRMGPP